MATAAAPEGYEFKLIAGGGYHSLALRADGSMAGWGWNDDSQASPPDGEFTAMAAGHFHSVAVRRDGTLAAWGRNECGESEAPEGDEFVAVAANQEFSLAARGDGSILGWGRNSHGQLDLPGDADFTALAATTRNAAGLRRDRSVAAWGFADGGACDVPGGEFVAIDGGMYHFVGLRGDGTAAVWGEFRPKEEIVEQPGDGGFTAVAAGRHHCLGLREDGSVGAWGFNRYGQCDVPGGNDFVAVAGGGWHSLALRGDGSIVQWGHVPSPVKGPVPEWKRLPRPAVVQTLYRDGVPHTDAQGRLLMEYDPARSFFPIGIYSGACEADFDSLKTAGYNCIQAPHMPDDKAVQKIEEYGLQLLWQGYGDDEFWEKRAALKGFRRERILANYAIDEPFVFTTGSGKTHNDPLDEIQNGWRRTWEKNEAAVKKLFPDLPVFLNMSPVPDAPQNGWGEWIRRSDIASLDNYPFKNAKARISELSSPSVGVPRTVWAAATAVEQKKPVWYIAPAFEQPLGAADSYFRFPTEMELRAAVYAALIHGATGIIFFAWDGWQSRGGQVIGISPAPAGDPEHAERNERSSIASATQMLQSRSLWAAAAQINSELHELIPVLLAPTVGPELDYSLTIDTPGRQITEADIRAMLKPHPGGGYVLLTVNIDEAALNATWTFPAELDSVELLFESRPDNFMKGERGTMDHPSPPASNRSFSVHYPPFATHLFRIRPK